MCSGALRLAAGDDDRSIVQADEAEAGQGAEVGLAWMPGDVVVAGGGDLAGPGGRRRSRSPPHRPDGRSSSARGPDAGPWQRADGGLPGPSAGRSRPRRRCKPALSAGRRPWRRTAGTRMPKAPTGPTGAGEGRCPAGEADPGDPQGVRRHLRHPARHGGAEGRRDRRQPQARRAGDAPQRRPGAHLRNKVTAIFHSDNGAQYAPKEFAKLCRGLGVTRSRGAVAPARTTPPRRASTRS